MNVTVTHTPETKAAENLDAIYTKIAKRIIPFLTLLFLMAWLDRYNLSFASLQMVPDLGFSWTVYGIGAGIVYLGYAIFEVPSNLLLEKIGARKTFARIAILWGLTSVSMMFVKTAAWFYALRFLLGSFEAGLFPGAVLYLTYWFPARRRAQMVAGFMTATAISGAVGGPLSGWIMGAMGGRAGLANWQWVFVLEGIPSVIVGLVTLAVVVDKPAEAHWLNENQKRLVLADLEADHREAGARENAFWSALKLRRVWLLTFIYFCCAAATVTIPSWIASIVKEGFGASRPLTIGLLSGIPYAVTIIAMILVGRHSDRTLERRYHAGILYLVGAAGLIGIGVWASNPALAFTALVLAVAAPTSAHPIFWQIPPMLLTGSAAAGGIALINSIGVLSGWVGPWAIGWLKDVTGKVAIGLYVVAGVEVLGAALILLFMPRRAVVTVAQN